MNQRLSPKLVPGGPFDHSLVLIMLPAFRLARAIYILWRARRIAIPAAQRDQALLDGVALSAITGCLSPWLALDVFGGRERLMLLGLTAIAWLGFAYFLRQAVVSAQLGLPAWAPDWIRWLDECALPGPAPIAGPIAAQTASTVLLRGKQG